MKKIIIVIGLFVFFIMGCTVTRNSSTDASKQNKNPKVLGTVKQISFKDEKITSILVSENKKSEYVFSINEKVDFMDAKKLKVGNMVEVEHTGNINVSFPAQGDALKITIKDSTVGEAINQNLYSVIPLRGSYNSAFHKDFANSLGVLACIIDSKTAFDKFAADFILSSENKFNLKAKYDDDFFNKNKLIFAAKFTSSTPVFSMNSFTRTDGKLNIVIEENTPKNQDADLVLNGFLIEIDNSLVNGSPEVNMGYILKVVTK